MAEIQPSSEPSDATTAHTPVAAVIPAWNRPADLVALLDDLARLEFRHRLPILVVDNGSQPALRSRPAVEQALAAMPDHRPVHVLTLPANTGGSGGFNAGMDHALDTFNPRWLWLIDSDARVQPDCLEQLLVAGHAADAAAVGAAIADPPTGAVFEIGARLDRRTGRLRAQTTGGTAPLTVDYAPACCLLVSAHALRQAGLMPDLFLHSDDVSFGLRLTRATGRPVVAAPRARCSHPRFDRFKTWARYYEARNWIVPALDAGLGPLARARRAGREIVLAAAQTLIGRDDLARLHVLGLRDAAAGRLQGKAPDDRTAISRTWPWHTLAATVRALTPILPVSAQPLALIQQDAPLPANWGHALRAQLAQAGLAVQDAPAPPRRAVLEALRGLLRLLLTPPAGLALVDAKAPPHAWAAGRVVIACGPEGYTFRRLDVTDRLLRLAGVLWAGSAAAVRLALAPPISPPSPAAGRSSAPSPGTQRPTLSIIILTRDRVAKLTRTLHELHRDQAGDQAEIIVVDNASADSTPAFIRERFPRVRVIETGANLGVEGFNRGVSASTGQVLLILDDDAWPAEGALGSALDLLRNRPDVAALTLHRRHPKTKQWEWPFDRVIDDPSRWPDMGPANLVRRAAWDAVKGYEAGYFLYRNDTDLALTLLASGREVLFTPGLHVWHDSPIARRKTPAWLRRSTRNWVWMCKRHGRHGSGLLAGLMGWLWAHRLARRSPAGHAAALLGALAGLLRPAPTLPPALRPDGRPLRRLLKLKLALRADP